MSRPSNNYPASAKLLASSTPLARKVHSGNRAATNYVNPSSTVASLANQNCVLRVRVLESNLVKSIKIMLWAASIQRNSTLAN